MVNVRDPSVHRVEDVDQVGLFVYYTYIVQAPVQRSLCSQIGIRLGFTMTITMLLVLGCSQSHLALA